MCHGKVVEMSQILKGISTYVPTRPSPAPAVHQRREDIHGICNLQTAMIHKNNKQEADFYFIASSHLKALFLWRTIKSVINSEEACDEIPTCWDIQTIQTNLHCVSDNENNTKKNILTLETQVNWCRYL